jgi:hypothetical protein
VVSILKKEEGGEMKRVTVRTRRRIRRTPSTSIGKKINNHAKEEEKEQRAPHAPLAAAKKRAECTTWGDDAKKKKDYLLDVVMRVLSRFPKKKSQTHSCLHYNDYH